MKFTYVNSTFYFISKYYKSSLFRFGIPILTKNVNTHEVHHMKMISTTACILYTRSKLPLQYISFETQRTSSCDIGRDTILFYVQSIWEQNIKNTMLGVKYRF